MADLTHLPKKFAKLPPEFIDEVETLDQVGVDAKVIKCEEHLYEIDKDMEKDDKLNAAKELVKELGSIYSEPKKILQLKIKYMMLFKESKGYI